MSKWVINDSTLTNIADSIREQLGESDNYLVSELAEKILDIEGGGGGYDIFTDEFTSTTESATYTIEHDLDEVPNIIIIYDVGGTTRIVEQTLYSALIFRMQFNTSVNNIGAYGRTYSSNTGTYTASSVTASYITATADTITLPAITACNLKQGETYKIIALHLDL